MEIEDKIPLMKSYSQFIDELERSFNIKVKWSELARHIPSRTNTKGHEELCLTIRFTENKKK